MVDLKIDIRRGALASMSNKLLVPAMVFGQLFDFPMKIGDISSLFQTNRDINVTAGPEKAPPTNNPGEAKLWALWAYIFA